MSKVYINGRSVIHKGDGQINTSSVPDVCKTPSPGGPVPIPYVNVAKDADLSQGSQSVSIEGHAVALQGSSLSTSSGDEPGTAGGGLISSKTKGKMTWGSSSIDVKIEGKGAIRFLDVTQHNGNTFNTTFIQQGGTGFAYGDDPIDAESSDCPKCNKNKALHAILETLESESLTRVLAGQIDLVRLKKSHLQTLRGKGKSKRGYMIGILLCKCRKFVYAAMSGEETLPGFEEAVKQLETTDPLKREWVVCGRVDFTQMHNSEGLIPDSESFFNTLAVPPQGNIPGVCAAPKLLQTAQQSKHRPAHMTEVYYSPGIAKTVEVTFFRDGKPVTENFGHGATTPSCSTCQLHVTPMLCGNNEAVCS
ncbi:DUF4150 domain-containing protein [Hyalangium minutum]|uniref:Uncharacterized protein n=1 Tax=Hyalangium minutum TaxID=394096 RepID=A0A085W2L3_9BACT|nr:DUF4150 domain-containing protein [Hyalangium minutum]KFE61926.1 hypothetical protein DB31_4369 [Hyalangium minutum]